LVDTQVSLLIVDKGCLWRKKVDLKLTLNFGTSK